MKFRQVSLAAIVSVLLISAIGCDVATNSASNGNNPVIDRNRAENELPNKGINDPNETGRNEHGWLLSYDEALKESKESGKPILIDFTGSDWCGWCVRLHDEVFSKQEFANWAKENVVLLEVDFPQNKTQSPELQAQNRELKRRFGIRGFPTIVFLNNDEKELGRYGYDRGGPTVWTAKADMIIAGS